MNFSGLSSTEFYILYIRYLSGVTFLEDFGSVSSHKSVTLQLTPVCHGDQTNPQGGDKPNTQVVETITQQMPNTQNTSALLFISRSIFVFQFKLRLKICIQRQEYSKS